MISGTHGHWLTSPRLGRSAKVIGLLPVSVAIFTPQLRLGRSMQVTYKYHHGGLSTYLIFCQSHRLLVTDCGRFQKGRCNIPTSLPGGAKEFVAFVGRCGLQLLQKGHAGRELQRASVPKQRPSQCSLELLKVRRLTTIRPACYADKKTSPEILITGDTNSRQSDPSFGMDLQTQKRRRSNLSSVGVSMRQRSVHTAQY